MKLLLTTILKKFKWLFIFFMERIAQYLSGEKNTFLSYRFINIFINDNEINTKNSHIFVSALYNISRKLPMQRTRLSILFIP